MQYIHCSSLSITLSTLVVVPSVISTTLSLRQTRSIITFSLPLPLPLTLTSVHLPSPGRLMRSTQMYCKVVARLQILGAAGGGDVVYYHAELTSCDPSLSNSPTPIVLLANSTFNPVNVGSWIEVAGDMGLGSHGGVFTLLVAEMRPAHSEIPYHEARVFGHVRDKYYGSLPGLSIDCRGLGFSAHSDFQV